MTEADHTPFILSGTLVVPRMNQIGSEDHAVHIERQVMLLLIFLKGHINEPVTRAELHSALWPESCPNEEALTQAVSKLRKAFKLHSNLTGTLQTIRKVGYRLSGEISQASVHSGPTLRGDDNPSQKKSSRKNRWARIAGYGAIGMFLLVSGLAVLSNSTGIVPHIRVVHVKNMSQHEVSALKQITGDPNYAAADSTSVPPNKSIE